MRSFQKIGKAQALKHKYNKYPVRPKEKFQSGEIKAG